VVKKDGLTDLESGETLNRAFNREVDRRKQEGK
jgi:hypothetical protein